MSILEKIRQFKKKLVNKQLNNSLKKDVIKLKAKWNNYQSILYELEMLSYKDEDPIVREAALEAKLNLKKEVDDFVKNLTFKEMNILNIDKY